MDWALQRRLLGFPDRTQPEGVNEAWMSALGRKRTRHLNILASELVPLLHVGQLSPVG